MRSKTCVITGATSGIGRAAAIALGRMGSRVILVGRNERAGSEVEKIINRFTGAQAKFYKTDLSDQKAILSLAQNIRETCESIDVLVNNAGARFDQYSESVDGIEMTFATNHLSHFLLTGLLLEHLQRAQNPRVITVSSRVHSSARAGDWCLDRNRYDRKVAYARSKLANLMFAFSLHTECRGGIASNAVDPGIVATHFGRNNGVKSWMKHLVAHALRLELRSSSRGSETIVHLALSESVADISGRYFRDCRPIDPSPVCHDEAARRELWSLSRSLTGSRVFSAN